MAGATASTKDTQPAECMRRRSQTLCNRRAAKYNTAPPTEGCALCDLRPPAHPALPPVPAPSPKTRAWSPRRLCGGNQGD